MATTDTVNNTQQDIQRVNPKANSITVDSSVQDINKQALENIQGLQEFKPATPLTDRVQKDIVNPTLDAFTELRENMPRVRERAIKQQDISGKRERLNGINNEILLREQRLTREIESTETEAGLTVQQAQARTNEIKRVANRELADLAIQQQVAINNLNTANQIVEDLIDQEFGDEKELLELSQQTLNIIQPFLNQEQNKALQERQEFNNERLRLIEQQSQDLRDLKNTQIQVVSNLEANLPEGPEKTAMINAVMQSKTPQDAISIGGRSGVLDAVTISTLATQAEQQFGREEVIKAGELLPEEIETFEKTEEFAKLEQLTNFKTTLQRYRELVDKFGLERAGEGKLLLDSALAELQVQWKELKNLGALTGPDFELINKAIPSASIDGIYGKGVLKTLTGSGKGNILKTLDETINNVSKDANKEFNILSTRDGRYVSSSYTGAKFNNLVSDNLTVDIGGNSVPVNSIIETEDGRRGLVNPDGTITPLN